MGRARRRLLQVAAGLVAVELLLRLAGHLYLERLYRPQLQGIDPDRDQLVLCLGESSTAGLWTEAGASYPAQLQRLLQEHYLDPHLKVVVPPHIGQNTSQVANRFPEHLERYRPRLVILMVGYNNEWSLAESHLAPFLDGAPLDRLQLEAGSLLERLRLFKVLRYAWIAVRARSWDELGQNRHYVWGHPELVRYPPAPWVYSFAARHRDAFVRLWRSDVTTMIEAARGQGVPVLLMTYHLNPTYLPASEFEALACDERVPLARNDLAFAPLVGEGRAAQYLFHDGWHPNRLGYALIAREAFAAITAHDLLKRAPGRGPAPSPVERFVPLPDGGLEVARLDAAEHLGRGWSRPEGPRRWTEGAEAEVFFQAPATPARHLRLTLAPFVVRDRVERQRLRCLLNGVPLAEQELREPQTVELDLSIPDGALIRNNTLRLELPDARSPSTVGAGPDPRVLGVAVYRIALEP